MLVECQSAMAGAALRLRLLYRMLRAGEVLALVALVSWSSSYVPSAVAAALRLAGSLLLNARFVFLLGNAIVLLLFALSRHDDAVSSVASSSHDDEQQQQQQQQQPAASTTATPPPQVQQPSLSCLQPVASADTSFPSFTTTTTAMGGVAAAAAASFASTPAAPPPSSRAAATNEETREAAVSAAREARVKVFDDEHDSNHPPAAVRVTTTTKARAPRRSRSEKMAGPRPRRAASPELRRCESENDGQRRRRSSVTARDAEACWGREDADEFRRQVEAFIARQTRFHREESIMTTMRHCEAAPAFTGALAVIE